MVPLVGVAIEQNWAKCDFLMKTNKKTNKITYLICLVYAIALIVVRVNDHKKHCNSHNNSYHTTIHHYEASVCDFGVAKITEFSSKFTIDSDFTLNEINHKDIKPFRSISIL
eukprot:368469_1